MPAADLAVLDWMSALADATRVRTLRLIENYELTVADLCAVLQLPQSTVSRHLKLLGDEGWLQVRPEGTSRLYQMANGELDPTARRLWNLVREQASQTRAAAHDDQRLAAILEARQSRSQAFFRSAAGHWDRLRSEMFGDRFDLLALAGLLDDSWIVGDLGCGTGQMTQAIAPFVRQVIAVDSSRAMLKAAQQRVAGMAHVGLRHGQLDALPIEESSLDAAISCLVLHHVADPPSVLRAAARALKPGGRLLVIDMVRHDRREYQQQMGHVWLGFEPAQMVEWLAESGFDNCRSRLLPPAPQAKGPAVFAASAARRR
ncbi:MAG TPA: metalloregulator ArsR/SmtB family transcription factor [Terriglobales bacterium]|nr:metalloregulator ArsR/SmtB family transcription factor [Terriglobales bacterium]